MRKQLMTGVAAAAICLGFASCSRYDFTPISEGEQAYANYENAFIEKFGEPAPDQTWGFGSSDTKATRSITSPTVATASQPYNEKWVADYLTTATEVNSTNAVDYADDGKNVKCEWYPNGGGKLSPLMNNYNYCVYEGSPVTQNDKDWYTKNILPLLTACNNNWYGTEYAYTILMKLKEYTGDYNYWGLNVVSEGGWVPDPNYVRNFKITDTWNGPINVVESEGLNGTTKTNSERTVVVKGKWNLTEDQKVGSLGRIIVADGGEIVVSSGKTLSSVNEAQIVVLPGGKITGDGTVAFHNGTSSDLVSYNGGTFDVGTFNNNGGDFYNYGTLKANTMDGGAGNSRYYNHGIINIGKTGSSANLRLYNACQFYCSGNMRIRNYEGVGGSSLICNGELMLCSSNDETGEPTYVGLAAGALVQCGTLNNNGTTWTGPTSGYAVLDVIDRITFINNNVGDFSNNIYLCAGTWDNILNAGNYAKNTAKEAFFGKKAEYYSVEGIINNNTVKIITKSTNEKDEVIPTDNYEAGVKGCTPGFRGKVVEEPKPIRVIAEDLSASEGSDFDFNDVVFDIQLNWPAQGQHTITLQAAGGKLPLRIGKLEDENEVHKLFGVNINTMVNTEDWTAHKDPYKFTISGTYESEKDIPIWVRKGNTWCELTAERGRAASKIAVSTDYQWVKELNDISKAYSDFETYVGSGTPAEWWKNNKEDSLIYNAQ